MSIESLISEIQKKIGVEIDGKAGPETWKEIYKALKLNTQDHLDKFSARADDRSEKNISTLHPKVRAYAYALIEKAASNGIKIKIISGLRTFAEQDALYAQGRTVKGQIVTNAKGGQSNHNFGIAFDVGVFEGAKYLDRSSKYESVGVLGEELGLEWGGNWITYKDEPHFQLRPAWAKNMKERLMLEEIIARTESGKDIFE